MPRPRDEDFDIGTRILIEDLKAKPSSGGRDEVLERARKLRYHDYSDRAYPKEKEMLVKHLRGAGFPDLAQAAMDGKYDQQKDASDEWAKTPEGRRMTEMVKNDPAMGDKLTRILNAAGKLPKPKLDDLPVGPDEKPWEKS